MIAGKNRYETPMMEITFFESSVLVETVTSTGTPINYEVEEDKWETPKIQGRDS